MTPIENALLAQGEKTVEEVSKTATGLLSRIFGPAADEIGLMYADSMRVKRLENQIRNFEKVKKLMEIKGFKSKDVDMKVIVPYLDGVALEENETLQQLWANLIVNYIDAEKNLTVHVYPVILNQLSSNEIRILEYIVENKILSTENKEKILSLKFSTAEIANLTRLGIITELQNIYEPTSFHGLVMKTNISIYGQRNKSKQKLINSSQFILTKFGFEFISACKR